MKKGGNDNLYVANNTIFVEPEKNAIDINQNSFLLFISTFNKRKELKTLVLAFNQVLNKVPRNIKLVLIENGKSITKC